MIIYDGTIHVYQTNKPRKVVEVRTEIEAKSKFTRGISKVICRFQFAGHVVGQRGTAQSVGIADHIQGELQALAAKINSWRG